MADVAPPELRKRIEESITKAVPVIMAKFLSSGGLVSPQEPSIKNGDLRSPSKQTDEEAPGPFSRGERFFSTDYDFML